MAVDQIDEFDGTRTVVTESVPVGYLIASNYETAEGYKMIDEGQIMFTFTQNDTLDAFFLILGLQEYTYRPIQSGFNFLILLENEEVIELVNFPDRGIFSRDTNMRLYTHTVALPLDTFYKLIFSKILKIRVVYEGFQHTLTLLPDQQKALKQQLLCLGNHLGLLPVKP